MMMNICLLAIVRYSLRCRCFHSALKDAAKALQSEELHDNTELRYWRAVAMGMCGDLQNSSLELETMRKTYPFLEHCLLVALIYFHDHNKHFFELDQNSYSQLHKAAIIASEHRDFEVTMLTAEFHMFISENYQEVEHYLHLLLSMNKDFSRDQLERLQILQAWYKILSSSILLTADDFFCNLENVTNDTSKYHVEKLMVLARYHEKCGDKIKSLECLNTVIAIYGPSFFPAYIERSKHHVSYGNFSLSEESALSALKIQKDHSEAFQVLILNQYLSACNNYTLCFTSLCQLVEIYRDQGISPSSKKWVDTAKLFSRICGRDMKTMSLALDMLVESSQEVESNSDSSNHVILIEHARILRCLGRYNDAILHYKHASDTGMGNAYALQGAVLCQMLIGNIEEANDQIDFLSLLVQDGGESMLLTLDLMFTKLVKLRKYEKYYTANSYAMLLKDACNIISSSGIHSDQHLNTDDNDFQLLTDEMKKILHEIVEWYYPSNIEALALLAKLYLELNDQEGLEKTISRSMEKCPEPSLVMVIKAQSQLSSNNISQSLKTLDDARAADFSIQQHPLYCLTKGSILFHQGKLGAADEQFNNFLNATSKERHCYEGIQLVTTSDKRSILKLKGETLKMMNKESDITGLVTLINSGYMCWHGFDIIKLKSDFLLSAGNIDDAINTLNQLLPKEMNEYDLAQFEIAQIQLNHKNDKKEYIQCYLNVANLRETSSAYFNLGMAYSHIFCLEDAKRAFGRALELDPTNEELAMKIGDFYVLTSQYKNALHVFCSYDGQVQNPLKIKIKLAHLYSITGQKDLALKIMEKIQQLPVELEYSNHEEQLYVFLKTAEIYCSLKDWEKTAANIEKGLEIQRMMIDDDAQGSSHEKKKELAAETAFHLSFCYFYQGQLKYSIESVQCAIELGPFHEKYSIALAKLLYKKFQFEECLEICCKHHEEHNIDISILVTKSLIALSRYDAAFIKSNTFFVNNIHNSVHYADTSKKFWIMISMHIYLLHILGEKSKIEDLCNQLDKKGSQNYGMMFCKGQCYRYVHQPVKALNCFNIARKSKDWSYRATLNMIEIYLHVDDVLHLSSPVKAAKIVNQQILTSANSLLDYLETNMESVTMTVLVLRGYWEMQYSLIYNCSPRNAYKRFNDILKVEKGNIGALLGMAISHKLSGSDIKAHNVLQNIVTMPFNFQFIREINNAYILLGNDYLHKGSVEMAHECCTKVLSQNKSLFYAWQLQGKVLEQRCSKLSEILECYEQCWDLTSNASCSAGYGAAALCLKMNNFSKALNIITKIYKLTPDNPHVKALIMKSASSLKP